MVQLAGMLDLLSCTDRTWPVTVDPLDRIVAVLPLNCAIRKRRTSFGSVVSNVNMEPMTGYDLLKEVRASPQLSQTPFIMITAESKTENVIAAKKAGVSNYIVKPFNAVTLKTKMEAVFPEAAD